MKALLPVLLLTFAGTATHAQTMDEFDAPRKRLIAEVESMAREMLGPRGKPFTFDARVLDALRHVPRHEFMPERLRARAYENRPQSIGEGQTISQPFIVALMSDLLAIKPGHKVLEVGTGSGYQAAVLAELGAAVYSVEINATLARDAAALLTRLGYTRIKTRLGDGYQGWPEEAPFDAIMATAAPRNVPQPLVDQLKPGGRLVVPVGDTGAPQRLLLLTKDDRGVVSREEILGVRFVPLVDEKGRQR